MDTLGRGPRPPLPPPPPRDEDKSFRKQVLGIEGPMFPDALNHMPVLPLPSSINMSNTHQQHNMSVRPMSHSHAYGQPHLPPQSTRSAPGVTARHHPSPPPQYFDHANGGDDVPPSPLQIYMSSSTTCSSSNHRRDRHQSAAQYDMPSNGYLTAGHQNGYLPNPHSHHVHHTHEGSCSRHSSSHRSPPMIDGGQYRDQYNHHSGGHDHQSHDQWRSRHEYSPPEQQYQEDDRMLPRTNSEPYLPQHMSQHHHQHHHQRLIKSESETHYNRNGNHHPSSYSHCKQCEMERIRNTDNSGSYRVGERNPGGGPREDYRGDYESSRPKYDDGRDDNSGRGTPRYNYDGRPQQYEASSSRRYGDRPQHHHDYEERDNYPPHAPNYGSSPSRQYDSPRYHHHNGTPQINPTQPLSPLSYDDNGGVQSPQNTEMTACSGYTVENRPPGRGEYDLKGQGYHPHAKSPGGQHGGGYNASSKGGHVPRQVVYPNEHPTVEGRNDDRYYDASAPSPERRDEYSGSSTIHTYSTYTPRQAPPPTPPANEYNNMPYSPGGGSNYHHQQYSRQSQDASRLSIEIPVSPQVPNNGNARQPPYSDGPATSNNRGRSSSYNPHPNHNKYSTQIYPTKSPRLIHAEHERTQSQARHQILKEIAQATNMKKSALDEKDRKFWERQIMTLNESFKKL